MAQFPDIVGLSIHTPRWRFFPQARVSESINFAYRRPPLVPPLMKVFFMMNLKKH